MTDSPFPDGAEPVLVHPDAWAAILNSLTAIIQVLDYHYEVITDVRIPLEVRQQMAALAARDRP